MKNYKADFPIFADHPDLVYLDSAATAQKPQAVIDAVNRLYAHSNASIHRGMYDLSQDATDQFEAVRGKVAKFIGAASPDEIVFTSGTTESMNMIAYGWARQNLKRGDIIVLTDMEHHANIVPWQILRSEIGVELYFIPLGDDYRLDYLQAAGLDMSRVKLITLTHASNVLGTVNSITEIAEYFKSNGADFKLAVDIAQSVPHLPVNVQDWDADFVSFSSHKMCGPSGVGALYGKRDLLEEMTPLLSGGHMIDRVTREGFTLAGAPDRLEPGTRNIEGTIGLGAAIDYLQGVGMENLEKYERDLTSYALKKFQGNKNVRLFGPATSHDRLAVFSFEIPGVHSHDAADILNRSHVAVRAGHHCAQPLMQCMGVAGTTRASLYLYNTKADIDALFDGISSVQRIMRVKK